MSRADELPNRKEKIEAGDIIEYMGKELYVKGVTLDPRAKEWKVVTEEGSIPETEVTLIHKRDRSEY